VTLHHRYFGRACVTMKTLGRDRADAATWDHSRVTRENCYLVTVGEEDPGHLQESDADACRLAMAKRLGTYEQGMRHPRPFTLSTMV